MKLGEREILEVPPWCGKYSARGVSVSVSVRAFVDADVFPIVVHAIENHFSLTKYGSMEYLKGSYSISKGQGAAAVAQDSPFHFFCD